MMELRLVRCMMLQFEYGKLIYAGVHDVSASEVAGNQTQRIPLLSNPEMKRDSECRTLGRVCRYKFGGHFVFRGGPRR
jgi:hypothetical protein